MIFVIPADTEDCLFKECTPDSVALPFVQRRIEPVVDGGNFEDYMVGRLRVAEYNLVVLRAPGPDTVVNLGEFMSAVNPAVFVTECFTVSRLRTPLT